jgi:hypothetical protein
VDEGAAAAFDQRVAICDSLRCARSLVETYLNDWQVVVFNYVNIRLCIYFTVLHNELIGTKIRIVYRRI